MGQCRVATRLLRSCHGGRTLNSDERRFRPEPPLLHGLASERCHAVVIVPARNEEGSLPATLDGFAAQQDLGGKPLDRGSFEIILLLNNCADASAEVARAWQDKHKEVALCIVEKTLSPKNAHVGMARRLLMDTAWSRLRGRPRTCGILSTDSDTLVAPDWIAQNLRALERGADAVGGVIELKSGELDQLPEGARRAYLQDREFQRMQAELEDLIDPQAGDPWPRHVMHFGASLACTPAIYERAGGLPRVKALEDMAFVDALYRIDARLRHEPGVRVFTSSRLDGRAKIGLSSQLRTWQKSSEAGKPQRAPCSAWLQHRFRSLRFLRQLHRGGAATDLRSLEPSWRKRVRDALTKELTTGEFLAHMDCDAWIAETYTPRARAAEISRVNGDLRAAIARERERLSEQMYGDGEESGNADRALYKGGPVPATRAATSQPDSAHSDVR